MRRFLRSRKRLGRSGQQPAAVQARGDIAGKKQIVDFEAAAERQQDYQTPKIRRRRQVFEPPGYFVRSAERACKFNPAVDAAHLASFSRFAAPPSLIETPPDFPRCDASFVLVSNVSTAFV